MNAPQFRIGTGYDIHRLVHDRPLILGGVRIPYQRGLLGHSDADVVCHAVIDALLGALALGDIGQHFPDTDPRFKNADSLSLLHRVWEEIIQPRGWGIANVDCTIVAQKPRLAPHIPGMREKLAQALSLASDQVSVKATTHEQLGAVGREEGISAQAVALLVRIP